MAIDDRLFDQFDSQFTVFSRLGEQQRKKESALGATMWDFLLRVDEQLKELIQSLMSTDGTSQFQKYLERHIEIVTYLQRLEQSGVIQPGGLKVADLKRYADLHHRHAQAKPLLRTIETEQRRLELLQEKKRLVVSFLADYKAGLLHDPDLNPARVKEALESDSLRAQAHSEFISEHGGAQGAEAAPLSTVKALLPENPDKITGLELMAKRYHKGVVFLAAVNAAIDEVANRLAEAKATLGTYQLTPQLIDELEIFKRGQHPVYNAGHYFHGYSRTLMGNARELLGYMKGQ